MTAVEVLRETDDRAGWLFTVRVTRDTGERTLHTVALSWADHEHWTRGAAAPADTARAVALASVDQSAGGPPERIDAARLARSIPDLPDRVRAALGGALGGEN